MEIPSFINPELLKTLGDFTPLFIGIGVFLMGEFIILPCFLLAAQGLLGVTEVFVAAVIGTQLADFFWFYLGRYLPMIQRSKTFQAIRDVYDKKRDFFMSHPLFVLLMINYAYGFRWSTIIYYSSTTMTSLKYIVLDFIGTAIYVISLAIVGFVTGKGIYNLVGVYHTATLVFFAIIAGVFLTFFMRFLGRLAYEKTMHFDKD